MSGHLLAGFRNLGTRGYYHSVPPTLVSAARRSVAAWVALVEGFNWYDNGPEPWVEWAREQGFVGSGPLAWAELEKSYYRVEELLTRATPDYGRLAYRAVFGRTPFFELTHESELPPGLDMQGFLKWVRSQGFFHGVLSSAEVSHVNAMLNGTSELRLREAFDAIASSNRSLVYDTEEDWDYRTFYLNKLREFYAEAKGRGHGVFMEFW